MKKILLIILVLFMTGCTSVKTATNVNNFETVALNKGFSTYKGSSEYDSISYISEYKEWITKKIEYSRVTLDDAVIEMIVYTDSESADKVQQAHIEEFNLRKSTGAQIVKVKGKNYYHYSLVSNNRYMLSTRVDNTLIFCRVMLEDKNLVDSIIEELGY